MSKAQTPPTQNLMININDQLRTGVYSNVVVVTTTSNDEVMIDFIFLHPQNKDQNNNPAGQVVSRIILPIKVAQEMKLVLESQLGKVRKE